MVQLDLEFNGVERSFSVSPLHATLIMHFEGKNEVSGVVRRWGVTAIFVPRLFVAGCHGALHKINRFVGGVR